MYLIFRYFKNLIVQFIFCSKYWPHVKTPRWPKFEKKLNSNFEQSQNQIHMSSDTYCLLWRFVEQFLNGVSSEAKKGTEKDTFYEINSYINSYKSWYVFFQEYGRDTGGSTRVILVLETKVLSNLMRSIQNSIFRDLKRFHLYKILVQKYSKKICHLMANSKNWNFTFTCGWLLNFRSKLVRIGGGEQDWTLKAVGKISNDKLIMRNKLNEEAECMCIRTQFTYFTLGIIFVVIGLISLPIQIKLIRRELLIRLNFKEAWMFDAMLERHLVDLDFNFVLRRKAKELQSQIPN